MEYQQVQYKPGKVTQIIFNRPEYLNAQSYQMLAEVDQAFTAAASDKHWDGWRDTLKYLSILLFIWHQPVNGQHCSQLMEV